MAALDRSQAVSFIRSANFTRTFGRISRVMATYFEADGPVVPTGTVCVCPGRESETYAEVVRAEVGRITLMPYSDTLGLTPGDRIHAAPRGNRVPVGSPLLGRVVNALGHPLDKGPAIHGASEAPLMGTASMALDRVNPRAPLHTGVRAIDTLLTLGIGQRAGIFASSGVGKTSLLTQLARQVNADYVVICLIGERGREAQNFWYEALSDSARARSVMVVSTSDEPAIMRARAAWFALAQAEHLRAGGRHVLLLLDSVTRFAMALREVGLAAGEPPTLRAYPPSVFAALPKLVERCGQFADGSAISALMTILAETDDVDDPLSETMRSLLDGHIVLSRELAEQGHFPAIHVPRSTSRLLQHVTSAAEQSLSRDAVASLSLFEASRPLIEYGLYAAGSNPRLDEAMRIRPELAAFLQQDSVPTHREEALGRLRAILGSPAAR